MTDRTQPEALRLADVCSNLTRYSMDAHLIAAELRRQHARIVELEAQLESIGAGGVSGPLMGRASLAASAGSEPVAWPPLQLFESPRAKILMRAWQEGWDACRDAEYVGEDAQNDAFNQSSTVNHCVDEDILYTHPSPPEGMAAEQALRKVLAAVQRYMPPDGPTAHDAMTEITAIVDPWPLGPLEKP